MVDHGNPTLFVCYSPVPGHKRLIRWQLSKMQIRPHLFFILIFCVDSIGLIHPLHTGRSEKRILLIHGSQDSPSICCYHLMVSPYVRARVFKKLSIRHKAVKIPIDQMISGEHSSIRAKIIGVTIFIDPLISQPLFILIIVPAALLLPPSIPGIGCKGYRQGQSQRYKSHQHISHHKSSFSIHSLRFLT